MQWNVRTHKAICMYVLDFDILEVNFYYVKIQHVYNTTRQTNIYVLTICLPHTTFSAYKSS